MHYLSSGSPLTDRTSSLPSDRHRLQWRRRAVHIAHRGHSRNKLRGCRVPPTRYASARVQESNFISLYSCPWQLIAHARLAYRLERQFRLRGIVLDWFRSYLSGRLFRVVLGGSTTSASTNLHTSNKRCQFKLYIGYWTSNNNKWPKCSCRYQTPPDNTCANDIIDNDVTESDVIDSWMNMHTLLASRPNVVASTRRDANATRSV